MKSSLESRFSYEATMSFLLLCCTNLLFLKVYGI